MSEEQIKKMQIDNLVYRLNAIGIERKVCVDKLWELETTGEALREELMQLLKGVEIR